MFLSFSFFCEFCEFGVGTNIPRRREQKEGEKKEKCGRVTNAKSLRERKDVCFWVIF